METLQGSVQIITYHNTYAFLGSYGTTWNHKWVYMGSYGFWTLPWGFQRIVQTFNRYSVIKQKKGYVQVFVLDIGTNGCVRVTLES